MAAVRFEGNYGEQDLLWQELKRNVDPSRVAVIHLTKHEGAGFGFNIRGGSDHPHIGTDPGIFITAIRQDGAAGRDGRLDVGDRILAVNAKRLDNICHDNAVDAFRTTEDTVALLIEKNAESYILASPPPATPGVGVGSSHPTEKDGEPGGLADRIRNFYHSPLGALVLGAAVGSLAILLVRKYRS